MAELSELPPPKKGAQEGYYPDPLGGEYARWWTGSAWTTQVGPRMKPDSKAAEPATGPAPVAPPAQVVAKGEDGNVVYVERAGNGMAVTALVCGIVGLMFGLGPAILYVFPLGLGAVAVVFGILGRRKAKREPAVGRKTMATWGLVLGILAFGLGIAGAVTVEDAVNDLDRDLQELENP